MLAFLLIESVRFSSDATIRARLQSSCSSDGCFRKLTTTFSGGRERSTMKSSNCYYRLGLQGTVLEECSFELMRVLREGRTISSATQTASPASFSATGCQMVVLLCGSCRPGETSQREADPSTLRRKLWTSWVTFGRIYASFISPPFGMWDLNGLMTPFERRTWHASRSVHCTLISAVPRLRSKRSMRCWTHWKG